MKKGFWVALGGIVVAGGAYTVALLLRQKKLVDETSISISSFRFKKFGLKESRVSLKATVDNKTDFTFMIHKQKYKLYINGNHVANIAGSGKELIESGQVTDVELNTTFSPEKIFNEAGVKEAVMAGKAGQVSIQLEGKLWVSSGIFYTSISFTDVTSLGELFKDINLKDIVLSLIGK